MKKINTLFIQFLIVLGLLVVTESLFWLYNRCCAKTQPFLVDLSLVLAKNHQQLAGYGYRLVDPLLGWGLTKDAVHGKGVSMEHNTVVVNSGLKCDSPFVIWITGASTSDIILNNENWPNLLVHMLKDSGYCCKIYVAATGGYNSGQEVLKTLRDAAELKVDIFLSYSGANEHLSPGYVSRQEKTLYRDAVLGTKPVPYLPNTVFVLRNLLSQRRYQLELNHTSESSPGDFWAYNMTCMQALAHMHQAPFIGILQPVAGTSAYTQNNIPFKANNYISKNQDIYPRFKAFADTTSYMVNLTAIFDTVRGDVYLDDCHINKAYQPMVARAVYGAISPYLATTLKQKR